MRITQKWLNAMVRVIGSFNILLSVFGLLFAVPSLAVPAMGIINDFTKDAPYFTPIFIGMLLINIIFCSCLLVSGIYLCKKNRKVLIFTILLFALEYVYFFLLRLPAFIKLFTHMAETPLLTSFWAAVGAGNMGIALQMIAHYPLIAIIGLYVVYRQEKIHPPAGQEIITAPPGDQKVTGTPSIGIKIFAWWFILGSVAVLISLAGTVFAHVITLNWFIILGFIPIIVNGVLGIYLLRLCDWARKGVMLMALISCLLTILAYHIPYCKQLADQTQREAMQYQQKMYEKEEARINLMTAKLGSEYNGTKLQQWVQQRKRMMSPDFAQNANTQASAIMRSCLMFLFIAYFFNRKKISEQFR